MGNVAIEHVYRQIAESAAYYGAQKAVLFGSRARRTNGEKSDIDLAVYGCRNFSGFFDYLQEELWSLLKVDVINMDEKFLYGDLKKEIERDGVVLYEKI